ncbi:MAG: NAD(P)/FAD-dependent oxidoreductase [Desulfobacteraceae bacterium]|nr:NAD(P)/FAD-dependent oxidoreductase [Desulfobacteraceae bacterium]
MNISDIIELSKKKSEEKIHELKKELRLPFFAKNNHKNWEQGSKKIVVIGSGIGGMASAALFAKQGHEVNVLEMNEQYIGGHGRCIKMNGLSFSMGPQYVWEFGKGQTGDRFLEYLKIKESNPFIPMEKKGFENIFIGEKKQSDNYYFINFQVPMGLENFRNELADLFSDEKTNINDFFSDMISIYTTYKTFFRKNSSAEGRFLLATKFLAAGNVNMSTKLKLARTIYQSLEEFFDQYSLSPAVRRILYGHSGIFAENEDEMSAIAYIIGTGNYHEGAWYPENGFDHFFDSMAMVIKNSGGSVETGKKVIKLETEKDKIVKVYCEDGSFYECDAVFSDISPRLTRKLIDFDFPEDEYDYLPSNSIISCCIGLKGGYEKIKNLKGKNFWWQKGPKINYNNPDVLKKPQMLFISSHTANGFGRYKDLDSDSLIVFCPGNYIQEKEIYDQSLDNYNKFKKKLSLDIIDILEKNIFHEIKSYLLFSEIITSVDIKNQTGGEMANAYGRRLSVSEVLKGGVREDIPVSNLYNVSATKNSPGIAAGIFTAQLLFNELTGFKI